MCWCAVKKLLTHPVIISYITPATNINITTDTNIYRGTTTTNERADAAAEAASALHYQMRWSALPLISTIIWLSIVRDSGRLSGCTFCLFAIATSPTLTAEMLLSSEGSALVTPASHISTFSIEKNHHNAPPVVVYNIIYIILEPCKPQQNSQWRETIQMSWVWQGI